MTSETMLFKIAAAVRLVAAHFPDPDAALRFAALAEKTGRRVEWLPYRHAATHTVERLRRTPESRTKPSATNSIRRGR